MLPKRANNVLSTLLINCVFLRRAFCGMGKSGGYPRKGKKWPPKAGGSTYQASTTGLGDKLYIMGTTNAAAKFDETREALARHVAQQSWPGAGRAGKAYEEMSWPPSSAPDKPLCLVKASDLRQGVATKAEPPEDAASDESKGEEFRTPSGKKIPPPPPPPIEVPDGMYEVPDWQYERSR